MSNQAAAHPLLEGTTPGPWSVYHGAGGRIYVDGPRESLAAVLGYEVPATGDANARLMAAAPRLAEQHALLLKLLKGMLFYACEDMVEGCGLCDLQAEAVAAIAACEEAAT